MRVVFFDRMQVLVQKDLAELHDHCVPLLAALCHEGNCERLHPNELPDLEVVTRGPDWETHEMLLLNSWDALEQAAQFFSSAQKLKESILSWSTDRHLQEPWFLDCCARNVFCWPIDVRFRKKLDWGYGCTYAEINGQRFWSDGSGNKGSFGLTPERFPKDLQIALPVMRAYNPIGETRQEYLTQVKEAFESYCCQQEGLYEKLGCTRTQFKRRRGESQWWRSIDWFIRYQVQGWSPDKVAVRGAGASVTGNAVYQAVQAVAKDLGFELRARGK